MRKYRHPIRLLYRAIIDLSLATLPDKNTRVYVFDDIEMFEEETSSAFETLAFYTPSGNTVIDADTFVVNKRALIEKLPEDRRDAEILILSIALHEVRHRMQEHNKVTGYLHPHFMFPKYVAKRIWNAVTNEYPSKSVRRELDAYTLHTLFEIIAKAGRKKGKQDLIYMASEMLTLNPKQLSEFAGITWNTEYSNK